MKAKLFIPSDKVPRPKTTRVARVLLSIMLLTLALMLASSTSQAHGGGFYLIRGTQLPPYVILVWTSPGILRTGDVHIDTSVFDEQGTPASGVLVQARFIPLDNESVPQTALAGAPAVDYPYSRDAAFRLETPGRYRLEISVSDSSGGSGTTHIDVDVATIGWSVKLAIIIVLMASMLAGAWLVYQTRAFWVGSELARRAKLVQRQGQRLDHRQPQRHTRTSFIRGGISHMSEKDIYALQRRRQTWMERLNGPLHAPAVWVFMLIIVAHWAEHVLQIYQIYALGWSPLKAGGLIGVIYPGLVESETLHFVYDLIQWGGIIILLPGFHGKARTYWVIAVIVQTWHYIEHVLLMGQYLTKYYLFGAAHQISILEQWFPRPELHFTYNLLVFIPMVIAVHYYLQPKLEELAALKASQRVESE